MLFLSNIQKTGVWHGVVFLILVTLSLPFEYSIFPSHFLTPLLEYSTQSIGNYLFSDPDVYILALYSDSTGLYLAIGLLFCFAFFVALCCLFLEKKRVFALTSIQLSTFLITYSSYYLSLHMLIYGCNKAFKFQFYDAHPNTLFTPVGFLTKDFLFWTAMGSSLSYNVITGAVEIGVGVLLWFRKTRFFGASIGVLVLMHIVVLNFSFDINVKIQSLFFTLLCFVIVSPNLKNIYLFYFQQKLVKIETIAFAVSKRPYLYVALKIMIIGSILLESLYPYVSTNTFNGDMVTKRPLYGAYSILNDAKYKRVFIHSDPYIIFQDRNDNLYSFPMEMNANTMLLIDQKEVDTLKYRTKDSLFYLSGDLFGYPLDMVSKKIDITTMSLYEDDFEWCIDAYNKK